MIRFMEIGGVQEVKVFISCRGRSSDCAAALMGTDLGRRPRPEGASGLQTTLIELIMLLSVLWRSWRARRE